jgi:predicted peptidase
MRKRLARFGVAAMIVGFGASVLAVPRPGGDRPPPDRPGPDRSGKTTPTPGQTRVLVVKFEAKRFRASDGMEMPYRFLEPVKDLDPNEPFPLMIVLHGVKEAGKDNSSQLRNGVEEMFTNKQNRAKFPCYVLVPQCPASALWVNVNWTKPRHVMTPEPAESMRLLIELIDSVRKEVSVDSNRIYVMGTSIGGFGVWDILCRKPDLFAAGVPVGGGGDETRVADIATIPIWAFHGDSDRMVPPERTRRMIAAVRSAGGDPKYTEFPGVGQTAWAEAIKDPALLEWVFSQNRAKPTTQPTTDAASQPATAPAGKP